MKYLNRDCFLNKPYASADLRCRAESSKRQPDCEVQHEADPDHNKSFLHGNLAQCVREVCSLENQIRMKT